MPKFSSKRRIRHSALQMFDLVADVERYPEFVPLCKSLKIRQRTAKPDGTEIVIADMTVSFKLVREAFTSAIESFGGVDIVVSNAGIASSAPIAETTLADWEHIHSVLLTGYFLVAREGMSALGAQDRGGSIVLVASKNALVAGRNVTAYSAAKGGIVGMTLPAARDLAAIGVRVVTIAPGTFKTPAYSMMPEDRVKALEELNPFPKRMGKPEEYGSLVEHICTNTMLNGEVIRIDGAVRFPPK